jgi:NADH:ubiquinone oxidoreductase subunit E
MAACDDVPAVMIETDYYPQVTPNELIARVHAQIGKRVPS